MPRIVKIPNDPSVVLKDLNRLKEKKKVAELYGCSTSGLYSYCKRKHIRFRKSEPEWIIERIK